MIQKSVFTLLMLLCFAPAHLFAQKKQAQENPLYKTDWNSLSFRSIGPAFTSGRVSDFAVNPDNPSEVF